MVLHKGRPPRRTETAGSGNPFLTARRLDLGGGTGKK
jgi:hypothetical protein